jgi:hypothetical protein
MAREKLRRLIDSLHDELDSSETLDDQSKVLLQQLIKDIDGIAAGDAATSDAGEAAAGQVETAALKFESEHPKLSMILGEIMDTLGKLGI